MGGQEFDTIDVLRLEVEDDPTGLVNLIQNPSGELGGYGWVTPVAGSFLYGITLGEPALSYSSPGGVPSYFYSEPLPVAAGEYVAASWELAHVDTHYRARFEWLDSSMTLLSSTGQTGYLSSAGQVSYGPHLAPASTAFVRLRFDHYGSNTGWDPTGGSSLVFRKATVVKAADSGDLGTLRVNLIPNPSFEDDAGGWAAFNAGTSFSRSTDYAAVGSASLLISSAGVGGAAQVATPEGLTGIPATPTTDYAIQFKSRAGSTPRTMAIGAVWYDAAGAQIGATGMAGVGANAAGSWTLHSRLVVSPSGAAFMRVVVGVLTSGASGSQYVDAVMAEQANSVGAYFDGDTPGAGGITYDWQARPPVVSPIRTNLIPNPSFETNTTGWTGVESTLSRITSGAAVGSACLRLTKTSHVFPEMYAVTATGTAGFPVVPGRTYRRSYSVKASRINRVTFTYLRWYDAAGALMFKEGDDEATFYAALPVGEWVRRAAPSCTAPAGAAFAAIEVQVAITYGAHSPPETLMTTGETHDVDGVMFEEATTFGTYFDGSTPDSADSVTGYDRAWSGTAHASASTETMTTVLPYSTGTSTNVDFIEPVPYLNVLGPTHDLTINREELNAGTLTATILDAALDPSQSELIRPGKRVRVTALDSETDTWEPIILARVQNAKVTYDFLNRDEAKRARVVLTAVDAAADLTAQVRTEGVGTIDELPFVLEGCGIPWNVNGSGNQVSTATVAARNENASALDQVSLTRDSVLGYAWVDRQGVLQAWDSDTIPTTVAGVLDEDVYNANLDIDYDTDRCINYVTVKYLRLNPATGESDEVTYGPYVDEASVDTWGIHAQEFTIQGIAEEATDLEAYAAAILAANATPRVRINSVTVPISSAARITRSRALLDLYDLVTTSNEAAGLAEDQRITTITHTISSDKWLVTFGFATEGNVATPQVTPSPGLPEGKTIGQLLRPVGEVTWWWGAKADIPAGWLALDGGTIPSEYTELIALNGGSTTLPNIADRFIIGAGTKALGTTGGEPTKTIEIANMPPHNHGSVGNHSHGIGSGNTTGTNTAAARAAGSGAGPFNSQLDGGHTHTTQGSGEPLDVMNPWIALWPIIRAA